MANLHERTVAGFGEEWSRFDQSELSPSEARALFEDYFSVFPWESLPQGPVGFDMGCGSGRWAKHVAPRVGQLHCVDASDEALAVARKNLADASNCEFHHRGVDSLPFADASMDFGYSLGVLHHIPDTQAALDACVRALKPGAPFLVYLYYRFDNRPAWFRRLWEVSDRARRLIARLPTERRHLVTDVIAGTVYLPLARASSLLEKVGVDVSNLPLSAYRNLSLYTMRTDALDRFGTQLEQRFTRDEIRSMMGRAGLEQITFREDVPYWCAAGLKRRG
jgi:ubiquinone/menaquinone biosynthesis C-methylase UbiE